MQILALQHRDRVCCVAFSMLGQRLQRVIKAIDRELPILGYLYFTPSRDEFVVLEKF